MAARYWVGGHVTNNNWNQTGSGDTNWSATSGGASGASVPGSGDAVIFDSGGNSTSTISATITIASLTIDAGYTSTITHNAVLTLWGSWTMHSGFTISGSSGITISAATVTITSGGKTWPNSITTGTSIGTVTLVGDLVINGGLVIPTNSGFTLNRTTAETFSCNGLAATGVNGNITGNAEIILTGGTWSSSAPSGHVSSKLTIAGNVTVSGTVYFFGGNGIHYSSGTPVTTGSTLQLSNGNTVFNTGAMTWNNITLAASGYTYTINSTLNVSGTLTLGAGNHIFNGTHGFNVNILYHGAATTTATLQFKESVTYTVYGEFNVNLTNSANNILFTSSHASTKTIFNLPNNGSCLCNTNASFRTVDASSGRSITTFGGTITDCTNVVQYYDYPSVAV